MSNPRNIVDFAEVDSDCYVTLLADPTTLPYESNKAFGSQHVGKAVTLVAVGSVVQTRRMVYLGAAGDPFFGVLAAVEPDGKATVQYKGFMYLAGSGKVNGVGVKCAASGGVTTGDTSAITGTDNVQTGTIGGTPTGGTFKLKIGDYETAAITWSSTNSTLLANIDAAVGALENVGGAGNVVAAAGTLTAGIGTFTLTFNAGIAAKRAYPLIVCSDNSMTGTAPTLSFSNTTPGVNGRPVFPARGVVIDDSDPGWVVV